MTRAIAALATVPKRARLLAQVLPTLVDQFDRVCVYLNGHTWVPACLTHPKIHWEQSGRAGGDLGDTGKMYWAPAADDDCYYFTVDDDILYPPNYRRVLVEAIERYGRRHVVGVHGAGVVEPISSYYSCRAPRYHCTVELASDQPVHVVGTGTAAWHSSTIQPPLSAFERPNMADVWLAIYAKARRVPMTVVARPNRWLVALDVPGETIYNRYLAEGDRYQTQAMRRASPWPKLA